jgi:glycosyltransferase involved in cell wall biosynthesis
MRVLHIYKDYAPVVGGIENHIRLVAQGLRARGVDARVLVTNTGPTTVQEEIEGVPVVKAGRALSVSSAPVSLAFYPWLYRLEADVDIAHAHLPYPPGELGQLFLGRSRRFVLTYHSDIVRQRVLGALYQPFLWQVLRRAHLITLSNPAYLRTSKFLAPYAEKCRVIPFGIDLARFTLTPTIQADAAALRQRFGPRPLILFVGKLRHYKGLNVLLEAMAQINAHLLVIGSGPMDGVWQAQAEAAGLLHDKVTFWGERSDAELLAAYHAAQLFVLPSTNRAETLGIVQLEAMACGLPLVCTELGTGTSFVNQHDQTGLVVPPEDPAALAAAINRILSEPELRARYCAGARSRAASVFDKEVMLTKLMEFYQEALQR